MSTQVPEGFGLPQAWRPEKDAEGDHDNPVTGILRSVETGSTAYGEYPIIVLEKENGDEVAIHAFRTVLLNEFTRKKPRAGEKVSVWFGGKQKTKDGKRDFVTYKVKVFREAENGDVDWDRFDTADDSGVGGREVFAAQPADDSAPSDIPF
jgi:hypothetical protein